MQPKDDTLVPEAAATGAILVRLAGQEHVAELADGTVTLTLPTESVSPGPHRVEVRYGGDSLYRAGASTVMLMVLDPHGHVSTLS